MSPDAWTNTELDYETLRIPLFSQPDNEGKCLVYSIWMVQNYIANLYPVDWVQDSTPGLEISEIEEELTLRDSGWLMREDELASLSEKTGAVRYRLREDETSHPIETFDSMLREKLEDKDLPTIVIYDVYYFIHGVPNGGPLHAAVVRGMSGDEVALQDPWGEQRSVSKQDLYDAWDARSINRMVHVDISEQTTLQTTLSE